MITADLSKQLWKEAQKPGTSSPPETGRTSPRLPESGSGTPDIPLNLRKHCIETEVKRLHHRYMMQYFRNASDRQQLESRIASLEQVMRSWDFPAIRAAYPELSGGTETPIRILFQENQVEIQIGERILVPLLQGKPP